MLRFIRRLFGKVEEELVEEHRRASVIQVIAENAKGDRAYWSLLIFSAIIATLGLHAGNSAVIIGAMVIAPLIWPILAVSTAVVKGEALHFGRIIAHNFVSFGTAVGVSIVISLPFIGQELNSEILLRSAPNVTDLFIALFSGVVATLSVSWPKITSSIAGVAIAASLMPPVSVIGISVANGNPTLAYGAFLLFLTNIFAIFMASISVFFILGYRPRVFIKKEAIFLMKKRVIGSVAIFILFLIPFFFFITSVYSENKSIVDSRHIFRSMITEYDKNILVKSYKGIFSGKTLHITTEIFVPIERSLTEENRDRFAQEIANTLNTPIVLDIFPIPILSKEIFIENSIQEKVESDE